MLVCNDGDGQQEDNIAVAGYGSVPKLPIFSFGAFEAPS